MSSEYSGAIPGSASSGPYSTWGASAPRPGHPTNEKPDETIVTPKFSEGDFFTLQVAADEVLSACWTEACKFAGRFRSDVVELEHLLLGATYIKSAVPTLQTATHDVRALRNELASRCTDPIPAPEADPKRVFNASDGLRVLLCETAALAARQTTSKISLPFLLQALKASRPRHPVTKLLSIFKAELDAEEALVTRDDAVLEGLKAQLAQVSAMCQALLQRQQGQTVESQTNHAVVKDVEQKLVTLLAVVSPLATELEAVKQDVVKVPLLVSERLSGEARSWMGECFSEGRASFNEARPVTETKVQEEPRGGIRSIFRR